MAIQSFFAIAQLPSSNQDSLRNKKQIIASGDQNNTTPTRQPENLQRSESDKLPLINSPSTNIELDIKGIRLGMSLEEVLRLVKNEATKSKLINGRCENFQSKISDDLDDKYIHLHDNFIFNWVDGDQALRCKNSFTFYGKDADLTAIFIDNKLIKFSTAIEDNFNTSIVEDLAKRLGSPATFAPGIIFNQRDFKIHRPAFIFGNRSAIIIQKIPTAKGTFSYITTMASEQAIQDTEKRKEQIKAMKNKISEKSKQNQKSDL